MGTPIQGWGTAPSQYVLEGYTFSSSPAGIGVAGTMPNNGAPTLQPGQAIAPGYYSGGSVAAPASGSQTFDTPGSFSFQVPSGVTRLKAVLTGAGGGGSGSSGGTAANITLTDSSNQTDSSSGNYTWSLPITPTWNSGYTVTLVSFSVSLASALSGADITMYVFNSSGSVLWSYSWTNVSPSAGWFTTPAINLALTSGDTYYLGWCSSVNWSFNTDSATSQTVSDNSVGENLSVTIKEGNWNSGCGWPGTTYTNTFTWYLQLEFAIGSEGGGGGAISLIDLIDVLPGQTVTGTVGAGGTSGSSPTAGGNTTLTVGNTTWTANGGGAASSSGPGPGGAASTQAGVYLSSAGQNGTATSGGAAGSLNGQVGGGAGATSSSAPGVGGGGIGSYNGGNGQVILYW